MKEIPIYEIHVYIKDTSKDHVIMYTEGKKYASIKLAHDRLVEYYANGCESPFITLNKLLNRILHQTFEYPDKTVDIRVMVKKETLVEEDE
jgi:predicted transglutaminase-like protease